MRSGDREVQEEEEDGNHLVFSFCYIFNLYTVIIFFLYIL